MRLEGLVEKAETVVKDAKYDELRILWNSFYALEETGRIPIRITLTMRFFANNLGINLIDHYLKPERYVEDSLRILCFQHEQIPDDRVIGGIVINFGESFESSLFGSQPIFEVDRDPLVGHPVIKTEEDLEDIGYPDFYESGLMPQVLEVYEAAEKLVKGRIPVFFERWDRSPWGVAAHLRGLAELLKDTIRNPDFVHRLLMFITESRKMWENERAKFLGAKTKRASLQNDEVNARVMSPRTYEDLAHPYEKKLADFYRNGIFYFHSCGDITPFLDTITALRGLRRLHISPATDFKTAAHNLGRRFVFQKRLDPAKDLELCAPKTMKQRIKEVLAIGHGTFMELDPGPLQDAPLHKVKQWIKLARHAIKLGPK
jgi:uroporphyrinogen-III decarboxylase